MHKHSLQHSLSTLEVGERWYIETELENYRYLQSRLSLPMSRRADIMKTREFQMQLFTAVSNRKAGDVRYLVCVERTK